MAAFEVFVPPNCANSLKGLPVSCADMDDLSEQHNKQRSAPALVQTGRSL